MMFPVTLLPTTARATAEVTHLAAGSAIPAALSFRSPAWQPGPGPSAGKQASGAGGPSWLMVSCHG